MRFLYFRLWLIVSILMILWNNDGFVESQYQDGGINYEYDEPTIVGRAAFLRTLLDYDDFNKVWPPKYPNGTEINLDDIELADKEWHRILEEALKLHEERSKLAATARGVPLCVDGMLPTGNSFKDDPGLKGFKGIFEDINSKQGDYSVTSEHFADANGKSPMGSVQKIILKSIYSPNQPNGIGRMNQWVHIIVKTEESEGLFIQGIAGPVGLPFGNFRHDFNCRVIGVGDDVAAMNVLHNPIVPCKYRPMASVRHPNVYAYNGEGRSLKEFRVHFNWEDVKCANAPRMQFLIIAVKSFSKLEYEVAYTQVYEQKLDSADGLPYPYYLEWKDTMVCQDDLVTTTDKRYQFYVNPKRSNFPIVYNKEYDDCIESDTDLTDAGCPPGPFFCDEVATTEDALNNLFETYTEGSFVDNCTIKNCPHPNDTIPWLQRSTTTASPSLNLIHKGGGIGGYDEIQIVTNLENAIRASRATHGHLMILAYMVLMAAGTFWARFYKESGGLDGSATRGCLGIGRWLWGHILIFFVAMAVLWVGVTEVIQFKRESPNCSMYKNEVFKQDCSLRQERIIVHKFIGSLSVLFFHVSFFTGWSRPLKTTTRVLFVTSHWLTGYLGKVLAIVSILVFAGLNSFCADIMLEVIVLEIISIAFFIGATFLQTTEDVRLGLPRRKLYPILDALEVPEEKSPCDLIRFVLVIASWVLHMLFYALVFLSYFRMFEMDAGKVSKADVPDALNCFVNQAYLPSAKASICVHLNRCKP